MIEQSYNLIDRQTNELAFMIYSFDSSKPFLVIQRHNFYSLILILEGSAEVQISDKKYDLINDTLLCLSPYEPYKLSNSTHLKGIVLNFHPDFFCTYKHQNEIEIEGVLFHNIYDDPFFTVRNTNSLVSLLNQMTQELKDATLAQHEVLVSYLKIFLINLLREKKFFENTNQLTSLEEQKPQLIQHLIFLIDKDYKCKHSASDYAESLNVSQASLAKMVKRYFGKTLTELISDRIITEAKRELYLTSKTVKEIAYLLGYNDEFYFSRFFKKQTGASPVQYRNSVGFAKGE
jgi:AraC family transcriptional activator of pobA